MASYESGPKRFKAKRALKDVYEYLDERSFAQETSEVAIKPGTEQLIRDKIKHPEIKLKMAESEHSEQGPEWNQRFERQIWQSMIFLKTAEYSTGRAYSGEKPSIYLSFPQLAVKTL